MIESGGGKGRVRACAAQLSGASGKQISSDLRESRRPRLGKRMRVIRPERNKIRLICGSRNREPGVGEGRTEDRGEENAEEGLGRCP